MPSQRRLGQGVSAPELKEALLEPTSSSTPATEGHQSDDHDDTSPQAQSQSRWWRSARRIFGLRTGSSFLRKDSLLLAAYSLGLLLSSVCNSVFFKKMTNGMPNYGWFLTQLTTVIYVPIFLSLVIYTDMRGGITPEMKSFPRRRFAVMGAFDSLAGICMVLGGVNTSGTTQVILQQATIPVTLLATVLALSIRYHWMQYMGSTVIIAGVLISKLPSFMAAPDPGAPKDQFFFNLLFFLASVPTALSSVYKEVAFRDVDLDVNLLQYWVAAFQLLIGFLLVPINTLPMLGEQRIEWVQIPAAFANGAKCLVGINTITEQCGGLHQPPCDACATAWIPTASYLLANVFYNVFTILVIKHGSAAISFLIATLRLPLTSMAFYSSFVMGADAMQPRATDFLGLLVIIVGLVGYRWGGQLSKSQELTVSPPDTERVPVISIAGAQIEPLFVRRHRHIARTPERIRSDLYAKLRVASVLDSPQMRPSADPYVVPDEEDPYPLAKEEGVITLSGASGRSSDGAKSGGEEYYAMNGFDSTPMSNRRGS
ncbi:unnamed protein product [Vitrella brassicaformis CCMP3155]|uniref:Uncharacterized protein n=2 Tax=Vitrella brassicaformis TaxID=1169539 RepID=A0A0G4EU57_VITBC|nr:unnamed protein product [Vitrella brassicaformis CCMP3155]|mmetsp:Transcript_40980/g.102395  ORF Transcript_40980/g.102395 Transcript_40980/m.102395 type:complete len:541 (+) Transcript_40980:114-1736(+)|eukprot:CEM02178.1 unnamed protein product [Vitrella brassicaformis CCMP3155]